MNEGLLSVKNASGRQVSLLNTVNNEPLAEVVNNNSTSTQSFNAPSEDWQQDAQQSKRKYHCIETGCNKSFTTSGHLARHNRIHTGEKNFPCLFPGCQSRFSRQDNMMQHYRTHMSPKSRRSQKRGVEEETRQRPRLHAHHRIRSDPVRVEPPLTIDQHLSNYHQSLIAIPASNMSNNERHSPVRFNFPLPLSSTARSSSNLKKVVSNLSSINNNSSSNYANSQTTPSPTLSHSSSATSLPSIHQIIIEESNHNLSSRPTSPELLEINQPNSTNELSPVINVNNSNNLNQSNFSASSPTHALFYQHRPLTFSRPQNSGFPYTLLHPTQQKEAPEKPPNVTQNQSSGNYSLSHEKEDPMDEDRKSDGNKSSSSNGLLQLAHIVSTFG